MVETSKASSHDAAYNQEESEKSASDRIYNYVGRLSTGVFIV